MLLIGHPKKDPAFEVISRIKFFRIGSLWSRRTDNRTLCFVIDVSPDFDFYFFALHPFGFLGGDDIGRRPACCGSSPTGQGRQCHKYREQQHDSHCKKTSDCQEFLPGLSTFEATHDQPPSFFEIIQRTINLYSCSVFQDDC